MHPRAAFRISLAAGLLVLAVTLLSATQEPVRPCGNLPQNYAPIIAFELARSAADLQAIFGTQEPCRSTVVERMDAINLVDVLVYIPAYGVFMAFFFLGMRSRHAVLGTLGFRISRGGCARRFCRERLPDESHAGARSVVGLVRAAAVGDGRQMAGAGCGRGRLPRRSM